MDETATTDTGTATETASAGQTGTGDVDFDTLIAQHVAANPDADVTETAEAKPGDNPDEVKVATTDEVATSEATPTDVAKEDTAPASTAAEAEIDARRARKILADAKQTAAKEAQDFAALLKKNPRAALAKHGLSLEELIDADLANDEPKQASDKKPETDLEKRLAAAEKRLAAREEQEQRHELNRKIDAVKEGIKADKTLEFVNRSNSHSDVLDFMQEYYNVHGQPIPWQKAAQLVEKDLRQRFGEPIKPAQGKPATAKPVEGQSKVPAATGTSTMTNSEVRTASPSDDEPTDPDQLIKFLVAKAERNSNQSH